MSDSYTSSSYYYSSATSTTNGTETSGHRYTTTSHTDPAGNTIVRTAHQDLGEPAVIEERRYDRTGQELLLGPGSTTAGGTRRIMDLTDEDVNYNYNYNAATGTPETNAPPDDITGTGRYDAIDPTTGKAYDEGDVRHAYEK
jgi:hypothetical protein